MSEKRVSPLLNELRGFGRAYLVIWLLSLASPLLYLAAPIYSENIVDRVLLSRNESTLWVLFCIALFLMSMYTALDLIRVKALRRIGIAIDIRVTRIVFDAVHRENTGSKTSATSALKDLTTVRDFLSGPLVATIFDAFWAPIFIVIMFIVHPWYGYFAAGIISITAMLAVVTQKVVKNDILRYQESATGADELALSVTRNATVLRVLGMLPALTSRWYQLHSTALGWQSAGAERAHAVTTIGKLLRYSQVIYIYTIGAILFLKGEVSVGTMMIAMLITMRALGPIDGVISNWKGIGSFLSAFRRLDSAILNASENGQKLALPRPSGQLCLTRVTASAPGRDEILINDISFSVGAGRVLGIVGPSGAGKSCLARLLVGIWRPRRGTVVFGDHDLSHWNEDQLGRYLGYVPQDVDLMPGTVAENIMRFNAAETDTPEALIAAAELAGIQDLIRGLPDGYNTLVGPRGHVLSGGQRQRIAFARAVYGNPALVVLDEPNSNLDAAGEQALGTALEQLRRAGSTVVVVTHKVSLLAYCDDVLVLNNGTVQAHGARDQIFNRLPRLKAAPAFAVIEGTSEGKRA